MRTRSKKTFSKYSLLFTPIFFLAACGGGGSDDPATTDQQNLVDTSNITTSQAESTAKTLIGDNINNSLSAMGDIMTNSSAINTAANTMGVPLADTTASVARSSHDSSPTDALEQQLLTALDLFFNNGTRVGDTITYDPNETTLCQDFVLGQIPELLNSIDPSIDTGDLDTAEAVAECVDLFEHVTMVLTILGEEQGKLDFKMYNFNLLTVGYAPNEYYNEFDLAQFKLIIEAMAADQTPPEDPELPSTFEGIVRFTLQDLGDQHGRATVSIEQAVRIIDLSDEFDVSIELAQTPKVFMLEANAVTNTASFEVALAAIDLLFPVDDINAFEQQASLSIDGVTLKADLINDGNELVVSNVGLGNAPLLFDVLDSTGVLGIDPEDLKLTLNNFGFTIHGADETIELTNVFDALLEIEDDFGIVSDDEFFHGSVRLEANNGSVLTPQPTSSPSADPIIEITSGFVTQNGRKNAVIGGDIVTFQESFIQGECISPNPTTSSSFEEPLFVSVACPSTALK